MKEEIFCNNSKIIIEYNYKNLNSIKSLCSPLLSNSIITDFIYFRVFKSGHYFVCSHDLKITESFLLYMKLNEREFFQTFRNITELDGAEGFIWSKDKEVTLIAAGLLDFLGFYQGVQITVKENENESFESYMFATNNKNINIYDFYLNNFDILNHFICYFKIKGSNIIENQLNKKLAFSSFYCSEMGKRKNLSQEKKTATHRALIKFLNETNLRSYPVRTVDGQNINLSERQAECLFHFTKGKTAKEIAKDLGISYRTVQTHLNIVNQKTGAYCKSTAIKCLPENIRKFLEFNYKKTQFLTWMGNTPIYQKC